MSETKESPTPINNLFRVIPKMAPDICELIESCSFDMAKKTIRLQITEQNEFAVLDWIANLENKPVDPKPAEKEVLTVFMSNPAGKVLCMLRFCDLTLLNHYTGFSKHENKSSFPSMPFSPQPVYHSVELRYEVMERTREPSI